jgi:quercetin dioxygenase-like cupin family protein
MNKLLPFPWLLCPLLVLALLAPRSVDAQVAKETPLMTRSLPDVPGREALIEIVVLAPGEVIRAHRHDADVFASLLSKLGSGDG